MPLYLIRDEAGARLGSNFRAPTPSHALAAFLRAAYGVPARTRIVRDKVADGCVAPGLPPGHATFMTVEECAEETSGPTLVRVGFTLSGGFARTDSTYHVANPDHEPEPEGD